MHQLWFDWWLESTVGHADEDQKLSPWITGQSLIGVPVAHHSYPLDNGVSESLLTLLPYAASGYIKA